MALFDPSAGMYGTSPGAGVMTPAIQNPLAPQASDAALRELLQRILSERAANIPAQQAAFRSAALRQDQPFYAEGSGPLGIRQGVGPGGWATSIGDAVFGVMGRKRQEAADEKRLAAQADLMKKQNETYEKLGQALNSVSQGSPLSPPLSY